MEGRALIESAQGDTGATISRMLAELRIGEHVRVAREEGALSLSSRCSDCRIDRLVINGVDLSRNAPRLRDCDVATKWGLPQSRSNPCGRAKTDRAQIEP